MKGLVARPLTRPERQSGRERLGDGWERRSEDDRQQHVPPFLLLLERTYASGLYRLGARIKPRDAAVQSVLQEHGLCQVELYVDHEAEKAVEQRREQLAEQKQQGYRERGVTYCGSPEWQWASIKQLWTSYQASKVLRVSVTDLLAGVTMTSRSLDQIRELDRALAGAIDSLAAGIEAGRSFNDGELVVYAPGSRREAKDEDRGVPPNRWEP